VHVNYDIYHVILVFCELEAVQVISANRLTDGIVVYAGHGGAWIERLSEAKVFTSKAEADAGLAAAQKDKSGNLIVEPCLVDITGDERGIRPASLREMIRAHGPTIGFLPKSQTLSRGAQPLPETSTEREAKAVLPNAMQEDGCALRANEPSLETA
jgi:hypothetical protein